jgi:catechol 2,3-dioxygenase-like lactoylglutathione lyase family enzyme
MQVFLCLAIFVSSLMQILQIKETCLYVDDLMACKTFYHDLLGLEVISLVEGNHVFFRAGTSVLLCFLPEKSKLQSKPPPHYAQGKQHIAFEVAAETYEAAKNYLHAKDIVITYEHTWPHGRKSAYFEDNQGHVLEIVPTGLWDRL